MHDLTRTALVSLLSWPGKGVYTARQTQLPIMVNRIKKSNGFHSTIAMQSFRKGFLRDMQPMDFCALSGGGFAPILLAGFFSDVADMETPILEDTAMNNPFCLGSSPLRFWFGELNIGCSPDIVKIIKDQWDWEHLLPSFVSVSELSRSLIFSRNRSAWFWFVIGQNDWIRLEHRKGGTKKPFFVFCFACNIKSTTSGQYWIRKFEAINIYILGDLLHIIMTLQSLFFSFKTRDIFFLLL